MKVTPRSMAWCISRVASASVVGFPNSMVPKQTGETETPLAPSLLSFMVDSLSGYARHTDGLSDGDGWAGGTPAWRLVDNSWGRP